MGHHTPPKPHVLGAMRRPRTSTGFAPHLEGEGSDISTDFRVNNNRFKNPSRTRGIQAIPTPRAARPFAVICFRIILRLSLNSRTNSAVCLHGGVRRPRVRDINSLVKRGPQTTYTFQPATARHVAAWSNRPHGSAALSPMARAPRGLSRRGGTEHVCSGIRCRARSEQRRAGDGCASLCGFLRCADSLLFASASTKPSPLA
jgi:hypothetical protein